MNDEFDTAKSADVGAAPISEPPPANPVPANDNNGGPVSFTPLEPGSAK